MQLTLRPNVLSGKTEIIPSKSQVHRLLICAALSDRPCTVECADVSEDIEATAGCLSSLGAEIKRENGSFTVAPINRERLTDDLVLDCRESGSTLRFLLPVIGALGVRARIKMSGRLPYRPLSPLWEELCLHGMTLVRERDDIIACSGKLRGGEYTLPGDISSQYISGVLFAMPLINEPASLRVTGKTESAKYIDMTVDVMGRFGAHIGYDGESFKLRFGCSCGYAVSEPYIKAEGDWSNAAFWLTAGALGGRGVRCGNLNFASLQGDKKIIDILMGFGALVECESTYATVSPAPMEHCVIDASDIPDLVPILAVCACAVKGKTKIVNAGRLRIKESDRLASVSKMLNSLGGTIIIKGDCLEIDGVGRLSGGAVDSAGDHRIAMSAAIASIICDGAVSIRDAQAVNKSYPRFWQDFASLGGEYVIDEE